MLQLFLAAALAISLPQSKPDPADCPVCHNKPTQMAREKVVNHGGFRFAHSQTKRVEAIFDHKLGIYWIEGEHIKLGFAEVEFTYGNNGNNTELTPPGNGALNMHPYSRAHAYLERAEEIYTRVQKILRVKDGDFPKLDGSGIAIPSKKKGAAYMGRGPYLGQQAKYEVLILPGPAEQQKYLNSSNGLQGLYTNRAHLLDSGAISLVLHLADGEMWDDVGVWGYMSHYLTHAFVSGYRYDAYQAPLWLEVGLAHYVEREINHVYNCFCGGTKAAAAGALLNDWTEHVKNHLRKDSGPYLERILDRQAPSEFSLDDHMVAWSMTAYLIDKHSKDYAALVADMHGITKGKRSIGVMQLTNAHRDAFSKHIDMSYAQFDKAWRRWAKKQVSQR